jgi:hypothetical protein
MDMHFVLFKVRKYKVRYLWKWRNKNIFIEVVNVKKLVRLQK